MKAKVDNLIINVIPVAIYWDNRAEGKIYFKEEESLSTGVMKFNYRDGKLYFDNLYFCGKQREKLAKSLGIKEGIVAKGFRVEDVEEKQAVNRVIDFITMLLNLILRRS